MRLDEAGYLGEDQRQPKIHVTPVPGPEGGYYFLSHFGMDTHLPLLGSRQGYEGTRLWRWHPQEGGESLGLVKRHDGVVGLAAANSGETLYATTFPRGLMLRIDAETGGVSDLGRVNGVYAPRHMLIGPNQRAWTLDHAGRFWWASSDNERVSPTKARLPVTSDLPGKLLAQGFVSSVAADDQRRHFAVTAWGALYRIDLPAKKGRPPKIKALGRPARVIGNNADRGPRATIAGLALGADGWLYMAVSGYNRAVDRSGDSYLIRCRPDGSNAQQLARLDGEVISYLAGCGAVDQQRGRVYFVGCHLDNDSPHLLIINTDSDKERVR
jgi:sugar lactone lactonase YvrE